MQDWERELLGDDPEFIALVAAYGRAPRACCGRRKDSELEQRPCSEGNCVEWFCPCGQPDNSGWGPVGCPCQGEP